MICAWLNLTSVMSIKCYLYYISNEDNAASREIERDTHQKVSIIEL